MMVRERIVIVCEKPTLRYARETIGNVIVGDNIFRGKEVLVNEIKVRIS